LKQTAKQQREKSEAMKSVSLFQLDLMFSV